MRKFYVLLIAAFPFLSGFSQASDFSIWSITGEIGFCIFDGDVTQSRMQLLPQSITDVSYGGTVEYAISPIWGAALDFYHFPLSGRNHDISFYAPLNTMDINATINFTKLILPRSRSKFSILGAIGIGYAAYTSNFRTPDPDNSPLVSLPGRALSIPVTFSLEYNISKSYAIGGKIHYRAYNKDNMEGDQKYNFKGVTNDYIGSAMMYLRYKFNSLKKKDHRRNIDMDQFDPPCCAQIDENKDKTDAKLDSIMRLLQNQLAVQNNKIDSLTNILAENGPDNDTDGVPNARDREPITPLNTPVDFWGKTIANPQLIEKQTVRLDTLAQMEYMPVVLFDFDKTELNDDALEAIRKVSAKMKADKSLLVEIRGFCDFMGNRAYNENLSQRRANRVKVEMMKVWGIAGDRIIANGKGKVVEPETKYRPNRRCEFFFSK